MDNNNTTATLDNMTTTQAHAVADALNANCELGWAYKVFTTTDGWSSVTVTDEEGIRVGLLQDVDSRGPDAILSDPKGSRANWL